MDKLPHELTPKEELEEIATWFGWCPGGSVILERGDVLGAVYDLMSALDTAGNHTRAVRNKLSEDPDG